MKYLILLFAVFFSSSFQAQPTTDLVEVYGLVTAKNEQGRYEYIPFVNIAVNETQRGTYANFEGMFSIAIYNSEIKKLYLARDRLGVKPLFFIKKAESIIFSSEITPLVPFSDKNVSTKSFIGFSDP